MCVCLCVREKQPYISRHPSSPKHNYADRDSEQVRAGRAEPGARGAEEEYTVHIEEEKQTEWERGEGGVAVSRLHFLVHIRTHAAASEARRSRWREEGGRSRVGVRVS